MKHPPVINEQDLNKQSTIHTFYYNAITRCVIRLSTTSLSYIIRVMWSEWNHLARFEFHPQFILRLPQFFGELSVSNIPALHHILRNCVYNSTVIVVISTGHGEQIRLSNNLLILHTHTHTPAKTIKGKSLHFCTSLVLLNFPFV